MAYPQEIDKFTEKLNKLDNNTYVIEEKVEVTNGVYEGELQHDNVSLPSINVYTGSKLTGDKIENVIVSTPSLMPWKNTIKIFSDVSPVYITYQTTGDTVEAEDVNKVQDSIVNTQKEVDRYKDANDHRVADAENRITTVENNKAEKTYVDTELNKRYLKSETYTKTETDQRIQLVVDAAPEALDTLKEIADSLNNDPDFAATITTALSKKVDKVDGKQLSSEDYTTTEKEKLSGIEENANKYVHPTTHPGSMITEDDSHRWTTDTEKANWNGKANKTDVYTKSESDDKFATKDELEDAGYGDMSKNVYDKNSNGVVDKAEDSNTVGGKSPDDYYARRGELSPSTDFNTILKPGCYKVQMSNWDSAVNSPNLAYDGLYSFGLLVVHRSSVTEEDRVLQVYYPHRANQIPVRRMLNSGGWQSWSKIVKGSVTWNDLKGV